MAGPRERYQKLGLTESLSRIYQYPLVCKELAFILRSSYSKLPKNLQSLVFQDILTAFRLLPEMQTQTAVSVANFLLQAAEAALPKQKKSLASKEFKQAMVARKRCCKSKKEEGGITQIPQDVLVHIFSFLDLRSLMSAALVCRSWNASASENHLWQLQYYVFFGHSGNYSKIQVRRSGEDENEKNPYSQKNDVATDNIDWRYIFKRSYKGISSKKFITSSRGWCRNCNAILWLSDMQSGISCKVHQMKPISTLQIVEYIFDEDSLSLISSSDSDSDSDEGFVSKMWAYPKSIFLVQKTRHSATHIAVKQVPYLLQKTRHSATHIAVKQARMRNR